jgi:predicted nucleic acid-binding protein
VNLYLDTSALVKLYVDEEGSPAVHGALQQATVAATSTLAYVEARSALARRRREGGLAATEYRRAVRSLDADWVHYQRVRVTDQLIHKAAETAESFQLRAYDAVHLASALTIAARLETLVVFVCWDAGLEEAARRAGLQLLTR